MSEMEPYKAKFEEFVAVLSSKSDRWKTLNEFIFDDVSTLLQMLSAIQTGDYDARNCSIKRMLPLFYSMDSTHYKRWAVLDCVIRQNFPSDLQTIFRECGVWRENITTKKGSYIPYDQFHETKVKINCWSIHFYLA